MSWNTKLIIVSLVILGAIGYFVYWWNQPGPLDAFAQCLEEKGAIFYGAFWCPHCQNQKGMFGRSARELPYVECSTPDGQRQLAVCTQKEIRSYPTWEFADGSRLTGEIPLKTLAQETGCTLP